MQEPLLFNDTIKENILYGNKSASDARIREVCEIANALGFIESSLENYSNPVIADKIKNEL